MLENAPFFSSRENYFNFLLVRKSPKHFFLAFNSSKKTNEKKLFLSVYKVVESKKLSWHFIIIIICYFRQSSIFISLIWPLFRGLLGSLEAQHGQRQSEWKRKKQDQKYTKAYNLVNKTKNKITPFGTHFIKFSKTVSYEVCKSCCTIFTFRGTFNK